ncbi:hypothetical protein RRU94_02585 [Domibacillus sp. DTU_2020_1001157_1_SI_ALB_TIR_016]|uniref:hypothetical protein n=1 Tax=Domibacillus sp. DTU_2020_1001157_1_SI_ALB_TIR_016 TaxID=3077789 RepID=UPI0028F1570E|nr:hypothetical protein [Domibacillus sp. DTU_2020_1001157_1_SI_ALB_TIR_016]WNS78852.1 hypothetical protein RRU94_02585 [Domibacillus sp. DTU_2020_1001157_1_SI_ALB_TIR_016]
MKVAKSLLHKIINQTEIFNATLDIYNDALAYVIEVIDKEFDDTEHLTTKSIVPAVEKLIHATKSNPLPKYKEFNERFYKFPSYFRRKLNQLMLYCIQDKGCSIKIFDLGGEVHLEMNYKQSVHFYVTTIFSSTISPLYKWKKNEKSQAFDD